jgi:DNA-binding NarL/FixJ family response regulator
MPATYSSELIKIGVVANEPMRLEGLTSIFENHAKSGEIPLQPIVGTLEEHLDNDEIEYVLIDWSSTTKKLGVLEGIRRKRPTLRMVVIGPDSNEQVVMDTIIAGARAYLDMGAGPRLVREALDVVISGSIWAPRKLLSKLIDRLLSGEDTSVTNPRPHLTAREDQVLQLLLLARSNREIAEELGIEERTVKAHVGKLMRKIGAENRIELSMRALSGSYRQIPPQMAVAEPAAV